MSKDFIQFRRVNYKIICYCFQNYACASFMIIAKFAVYA